MQKKVCLGDLATYINGYAFKPSDWGQDGLPIIRIQNLTGNAYEVNYFSGNLDKRYFITNGDVLISWSASIGVYEWQNGDAWLNQHIFKVKFDKENVDKKYFQYAVGYVLEKSLKFAHGSTMKHLTKKVFDSLQVPYYDMDTQRQIVAKLAKIDIAIKYYEEIFECLDELVKSRFIELFGDPMTNPKRWELVTLGDAVKVKPQNGLYKPQSDYVTNSLGTPILRIDAFYDGRVKNFAELKRLNCTNEEIQKYLLQEDDIVINRVNSLEYLGKCAHITGLLENTVYESNMMRFHMQDGYNPIYTTHLLCTPYMKKQIKGCAKQAVNQASKNQQDVQSFTILKPPIDLQNQFADFVVQTDKSKHAVQQSIETLQTLKAKLMQDYFG